jgi:hypothetical protein
LPDLMKQKSAQQLLDLMKQQFAQQYAWSDETTIC